MKPNEWLSKAPMDNLKLMTIDKEIVDKYINNQSTEPYVKKTVENGVVHYDTVYNEYKVKEERIGDKVIYYVYLVDEQK